MAGPVGSGAGLIIVRLIQNTTNAITMNAITRLMNAP